MSAAKREPAKHRPSVIVRDGNRCLYCGGAWEEIEHLIPRRHGGPSAIWNLGLACGPCNRRKFTQAWPEAIDHLIRNLRLLLAETALYVDYQRALRQLRESSRLA